MAIIQPPVAQKQRIQDVIKSMPVQTSNVEALATELLWLGGQYQRNLHQDEFGPTRAERMAALRPVIKQLDNLLQAIGELPASLQLELSAKLAGDELAVLSSSGIYYSIDIRTVNRLRRAAERILHHRDCHILTKLKCEAEQTQLLLHGLDTTTCSEIALDGTGLVRSKLGTKRVVETMEEANESLLRLRQCAMAALENLERQRGAERAISLRLLVSELCKLWERETEMPVTSDCVGYRPGVVTAKTVHKAPVTPAGRFILDLLQAFSPDPQSKQVAGSARAQKALASNLTKHLSVIDNAVRGYVGRRPKRTKRGRPRKP